jgi:hypothetical protein
MVPVFVERALRERLKKNQSERKQKEKEIVNDMFSLGFHGCEHRKKTKGRLSLSIYHLLFWGCRCSVSFRQEKIEFRFFPFFLVCRSKVHAELLIPPVLNDMKTHYVFFFFFFLFHIISQKG